MEESLLMLARYLVGCPEVALLGPKAKTPLLQLLSGIPTPAAVVKEIALKLPFSEALAIIGEKMRAPMFSQEVIEAFFLGYNNPLSFEESLIGAKAMLRKVGFKEEMVEKVIISLPSCFNLTHNHFLFLELNFNSYLSKENIKLANSCLVRPAKIIEKQNHRAKVIVLKIEEDDGYFFITKEEEEVLTHGVKVSLGQEVAIHWGGICQIISPSKRKKLSANIFSALSFLNNRGQ